MSLASDRARNGSRRQRDVAALTAERYAVPSGTTATEPAERAWEAVSERLRRDLAQAHWQLWIEPCELIGEHRMALVIAAPHRKAAWVRVRYGMRLGCAVREETDFDGLFVCDKETK